MGSVRPVLSLGDKKIDWSRLLGVLVIVGGSGAVWLMTPWFLWGRGTASSSATMWSGLLVLFALVGLICSVSSRRRGLADFLLWIFALLFMAWPGWIQNLAGYFPFGPLHRVENTAFTAQIVMLFCICYVGGWELAWRRIASHKDRGEQSPVIPDQRRLRYYLAGIALVAAAGILLFGPARLMSSRVDLAEVLAEPSAAYPLFLAKGAALSGFLLSMIMNSKGGLLSRVLLTGVLAIEALLVFNPISNPRFQTLGLAFALIAFGVARLSPLKKALGVVLLFLSCFGAFAAFKHIGNTGSLGDVSLDMLRIAPYSVDFDSLQQATGLVTFTMRKGTLHGMNFVGAILFFVPRVLWPDKPYPTSITMAQDLGYTYFNVSAPLPGEAFAGLGVGGVVLIGWLLGVMLGRMEATRVTSNAPLTRCFYAIITGYIIILLRGSLSAVLPQFGLAFLFLGGARLFGAFQRPIGRSDYKAGSVPPGQRCYRHSRFLKVHVPKLGLIDRLRA